MEEKQPTFGNGKICYIEIPADDVTVSANFFETVFNWRVRTDDAGNISFDDGVGEVSGMWTTGRKPVGEPGLTISIMVDDAEATLKLIEANGGLITRPIDKDAPEITAHFQDPAGNGWGIYQHGG